MHFPVTLKIHTYTSGHIVIHSPTTPALQLQIKALSNTPRHTYGHTLLSQTQLQMKLPLHVLHCSMS